MLIETNFGKNNLRNLTLLGGLGVGLYIWIHWPKIEKYGHKLRSYGVLEMLNTFLVLSYLGETDYDLLKYFNFEPSFKLRWCVL